MAVITATIPTPDDPPAATKLVVPPDVRLRVDLEGFTKLCESYGNRELRLERWADGALTVLPPAYTITGMRNAELTGCVGNWNMAAGLGHVYPSCTGFTMPNDAVLSPDTSWIANERWDALTPEDRQGFARVVPDFVAELRSSNDDLDRLRAKMAEYIAQGARLGWLIDPEAQAVEVYSPGREPEVLTKPATLSGEDVLPGFTLDLQRIMYEW